MRRHGYGWAGYNLPQIIIPQEPTGFVAKYTYATLIANGATSPWEDESGNNNDLVQVTVANQPTTVLGGTTYQNTLDFDTDDNMTGLPSLTGDWSYMIEADIGGLGGDTTVYDVNSATLNGSTQYYDAGNSNDLDVSSSFTLNIWVHPTVLNTSNVIFSKWNTSSGDWSFISSIINGKPYITFSTTGSDTNELTGATDIVVDQMYMITATYDGSTLKLYANGVEDANSLSVTGNVYISSESLRIGSVRDNNNGSILYFTGSLAMPMIYNRALTSTEITALYNEGTVPCYADIDTSITDDCVYAPPLYNGADVSVGQELTDQSTSGITTTPINSPTYTDQGLQVECTPSDTTVYDVNSLTLLDDANYVTATKSASLATESDQTWSFRVKIPDLSSRSSHQIFTLNYSAPSARSSLVSVNTAGSITVYNFPTVGSTSGSKQIVASNAMTSGVWYNITVVFDVTGADIFYLYVDNVLKDSWLANGAVGNSNVYDLGIGTRWATKTSDMEGYLSNLRIWNRVLTASELTENYNGDAELYNCYDKLVADGSTLVNGLIFDSDLEDSNLTEHTGNSTLTAIGSPTYTDQGLQVECTSSPTTKYFLQETGGNSAILALADNYMYLRDTTGANDILLDGYVLETGKTQFFFIREGDILKYYVNSIQKGAVDVTGRTFTFGDVGASADSADSKFSQIIPFDRALTQSEIDYYSYLRDANTGKILLPPLLPDSPPPNKLPGRLGFKLS